jgi:hypothetical protein
MTIRAPPARAGIKMNEQYKFYQKRKGNNMSAVIITGYLPKEVATSKHKSARTASGYIRSVVKKANGSVKNLEVMMGNIFITLKDDNGLKELKDALSTLDGVKVEEPSQAMLIFIKERARNEAQLLEKSAA